MQFILSFDQTMKLINYDDKTLGVQEIRQYLIELFL
jgi:hypothetical protein